MKNILLSLLIIMPFTGMFAQIEEPEVNYDSLRDEIINKSEFVFEGIIIKQNYYIRKGYDRGVVCSNIVKITKLFRGNLKIGTVDIEECIPDMDIYDNTDRDECDALCLKNRNVTTFGIFFCRVGNEFPYNPKYNIDKVDNSVILAFKDVIQIGAGGYIGNSLYRKGKVETKAQVYNILRKYPNLNIPNTAEKESWDWNDEDDLKNAPHFRNRKEAEAYWDSVNCAHGYVKPLPKKLEKDTLKNSNNP